MLQGSVFLFFASSYDRSYASVCVKIWPRFFKFVYVFNLFYYFPSSAIHVPFLFSIGELISFSHYSKYLGSIPLEFQVSKNQLIHTPWLPTVRKKSRKNKFLQGQGKSEFHLVFTSSRELGKSEISRKYFVLHLVSALFIIIFLNIYLFH